MDPSQIKKFIEQSTPDSIAGLDEIIICIYGDKKVGKSTFAAAAPDPLFLSCEDGIRTVSKPDGKPPDQVRITSWNSSDDAKHSMMTWIAALEQGSGALGYKTLVIDGINELYRYLQAETLKKYGAEHINEGALGYGKGRDIINDTFHQWFQRLRRLPIGIIVTAHDSTMEFENNGVKYDKKIPFIEPSRPAHGWNTIKPAVSMILHAVKEGRKDDVEHVMYTKGSEIREAADPKGCLPNRMNLSYAELAQAYNNNTKTTGKANDSN